MYFNFLLIKSRRVAFEQRLRNLEEKIRKSYQNDEATYKILKEQVEKLEEALSNQKQARQLVSQRNDKELKVIETNLNIQNNVDRQSKREAENELLGNFDGKLNSLRADMISDKRENDGKMASLLGNISDELSMIQGELYAERKSREENYDSVIKKLGNWVLKLDTMVNNEKRVIICLMKDPRRKPFYDLQNARGDV